MSEEELLALVQRKCLELGTTYELELAKHGGFEGMTRAMKQIIVSQDLSTTDGNRQRPRHGRSSTGGDLPLYR